jgi:2-keto-4-pentenoate hydratase/2-oxohepta-3-ene-1,7-dioic acid hydratase in catechol pathway
VDTYGIPLNKEVLCLPLLASIQGKFLPTTLEELVSSGVNAIKIVEKLVRFSEKFQLRKAMLKISDIRFKAPLFKPPKIVCLGLNYRDHLEEQGGKPPSEPIIFMKPRTAIIGPNENIVKPKFVKKLDYEGELAIVIGREGKNISVEKARNHILGYTIMNDVSARDIQFDDGQWTRGKSFDTFAPLGPYITLTDQIGDPNNLRIRTWVNKRLRQDSSTKNMIFNVYETIFHLSRVMTLEVGDIIATGTPAGVGAFIKPEPQFLKHGDIVEIEIEKIGVLRNRVIEK